jgi:hypothetical protein
MMSGKWSLCVQLDIAVSPPVVADVEIVVLNGCPAYKPHAGYKPGTPNHQGHGPRAVLTEVEARSPEEAELALKGIVQKDPALAWVLEFPSVKRWLSPMPF